MKPRKLKEKYAKSENPKEEVEKEKARKEAVGWKCTLSEEGDDWVLLCTAG